MSDSIEASFDTLMRQASMTATDYMTAACRAIDGQFGQGYAKANPALVASFMQVAASDFNTACTAKVFGASIKSIGWSLDNLADKLSS
jgi:hypothetical protein